MSKIVLIGNSDIDKNKKYGKIIDDFDEVVRFNRFELDGFENYIGNKTTTWVLNRKLALDEFGAEGPRRLYHRRYEERKQKSPDLNSCLIVTYVQSKEEVLNLQSKVKEDKFLNVADTFEVSEYMRDCWKLIINRPIYKPATGISTIIYYLQRYDKIYLHNFDFGKTKHYWGDVTAVNEPWNSKHVWYFDEQMVSNFIDEGRIEFLTEDNCE